MKNRINRFYFKVKNSTNKNFSPNSEYDAYEVYQLPTFGTQWFVNSNSHGLQHSSLSGLETSLRNQGVDGEIIALPFDAAFFRYTGTTNSSFESNKIYMFRADMVDYNAKNPFEHCVMDTTIHEEDLHLLSVTTADDYDKHCITPQKTMRYIFGDNSIFKLSNYPDWYKQERINELRTAKVYPHAILTDKEYRYIFECITSLLDEYRYKWTKSAIDKIIQTWLRNKGELISAFRAHPAYNGKFQLVFSKRQYQMNTNKDAGHLFMEWVCKKFKNKNILVPRVVNGKTYQEWAKECERAYQYRHKDVPVRNGDILVFVNTELRQKLLIQHDYAVQMLNFFGDEYTLESVRECQKFESISAKIQSYQNDRVDADFADFVNELFPEFRVREGQKTTKVVGKVMRRYGIDTIQGYTQAYAKYCDDINVINITRHTILSVHPCDYLTMSFGNSWTSCHTIDKLGLRDHGGQSYDGCYSSGTISYMLDQSSFVLYTIDHQLSMYNELWRHDKINRCMFHVMNERIVQGRCYPQGEDGNSGLYTQLRNLVQKVMSEVWEVPNMWKLQREDNMYAVIGSDGTHYRDYEHFSDCNMSVLATTQISNAKNLVLIGNDPICVTCGYEHDTENCISCCEPPHKHICTQCGAELDDDEINIINDDLYCNDCVFYCEYHGEYERIGDQYIYVENYGWMCEDAWNNGDFEYCDDCKRYYYMDDMTGTEDGDRCYECLQDNYMYIPSEQIYVRTEDAVYCSECDEYFCLNHLETNTDGNHLCPCCGSVCDEDKEEDNA